jgi:hypothetical protein
MKRGRLRLELTEAGFFQNAVGDEDENERENADFQEIGHINKGRHYWILHCARLAIVNALLIA